VLVVGLTIAGVFEGAAIGVAQSWVLARHVPVVNGRAWVVAAMRAAGFAWFVGMGGSALVGSGYAPVSLLLAVLLPAMGAALLAMGYAQWRVRESDVPKSGRWIWVTSGAWLLGVMIPVLALSLAPNAWPGWALAAVAMGVTVGALTGRTLERLLSAAELSSRDVADPC